jgi:hypothetical protein
MRNVFLTVLEDGKSKIKVPADSVSGKDLLSGVGTHLLVVYPHSGRELWSSQPFIKVLISSMRLHPWDLILPNPTFECYNIGG